MSPAARQMAMRHTAPHRVRQPHRRKRRGGGWTGLLAAVVLFATGAATQAWWRDLLPGGSVAQAADTGGIPPLAVDAPAAKIAAFDAPRDYLVLPAGGALTVSLREGPGDQYPQLARLGLHDAVVGRGTSSAPGTGDWVWVTRSSDGLAGYVHKSGLLERSPSGVAGEAPATSAELVRMAQTKRGIDAQYKRLLAGAAGYDRTYLIDGQRLWEAQRRRCDDAPEPMRCRQRLDTQRKTDLEDWGTAERTSRQPIVPASLDTLR
jgi:hypothetical protein